MEILLWTLMEYRENGREYGIGGGNRHSSNLSSAGNMLESSTHLTATYHWVDSDIAVDRIWTDFDATTGRKLTLLPVVKISWILKNMRNYTMEQNRFSILNIFNLESVNWLSKNKAALRKIEIIITFSAVKLKIYLFLP